MGMGGSGNDFMGMGWNGNSKSDSRTPLIEDVRPSFIAVIICYVLHFISMGSQIFSCSLSCACSPVSMKESICQLFKSVVQSSDLVPVYRLVIVAVWPFCHDSIAKPNIAFD